ncbi:S24 family peptidase [Lampropedia aestuarii]|nr:S24 family peptidase [Lampropedia aestuarii]
MDASTFFNKVLALRELNPNALAAAIRKQTAQSGFDRLRKGEIKQPKRGGPIEDAAKYLKVDVLAFYDERVADSEWNRISGKSGEQDSVVVTANLSPAPAPGEDAVRVPLLANAGSMGPGNDVHHSDVIVGAISLSPEWLDKRIRPTSHRALGFIHAYGDSMSPTFEDGDILLVDTGLRDPSGADGVYVLEANHRIFIKRVTEKLSGGHIVTSDNPSIKTTDELNGDSEVQVKGKVVWVWNGRKL